MTTFSLLAPSLIAWAIAVACYAISQLMMHSKLKWAKAGTGFWDEQSWKRKWKPTDLGSFHVVGVERFWGSSRWFVFLTDGYHLMQFFFIKLFVLSIVLYVPAYSWVIDGGIFLGTWYIVFSVTYKVFGR